MHHLKTTTLISLRVACFLLVAGSAFTVSGQRRVPPVPFFDTPAKVAKAEAYRAALDDMIDHLCREPRTPRTDDEWASRFKELETKLIVSQHAVIWAAAGGANGFDTQRIGDFHNVRLRMVALMEGLLPIFPGLREPTALIRDSENKFSSAARKARNDDPVAAVNAYHLMLYEFDRYARRPLQQRREYPEYRTLMKDALNILSDIQFRKYERGRDETEAKVPVEAAFLFMVNAPSKGNELRTTTAIMTHLLGADLMKGVDAMELLAFDTEFSWHNTSAFSPAELSPVIRDTMKGQCPKEVVEIVYAKPREIGAGRVEDILVRHNYEVRKRVAETGEATGVTENHRRIYYQKRGTTSGAAFMTKLLTNIDNFRAVRSGSRGGETAGPDYTVWLLEFPRVKRPRVDVVYSKDRSEDAIIAAEVLENNGYKVERKPVEDVASWHPKKLVFRPAEGAAEREAREIARVVRAQEAVQILDMGPMRGMIPQTPYELWIIEKKQDAVAIDLNGMWRGYNYNCPGDPAVQEIRIEQEDTNFIGIKVSGNKCVVDGEVTIRGTIVGSTITGEMNHQIGGGTQREFKSATFKVENDDLIIVNGKIQLRRVN